MRNNFVMIMAMCATREEARKIADAILKKKLVACANIVSGIESKFWWKGKIDKADEFLVIAKTTKKNYKVVEAEVKKLHSYEVPEIIAIPIVAGSKEYLKWIGKNVRA